MLHRPLLAATVLLAGASFAQPKQSDETVNQKPSDTETVNPRGWSTGSTTVPPGKSGMHTPSGVTPEGPPLPPPVSSALGTTPAPDMVLAELHAANVAEIDLGKLAEQRARSSDVKKFAQHMIQAHTDLDRQAQSWARANHLTIPPQAADHETQMARFQARKQRLQSLSGAAFDRAYMQAMVDDHARVLSTVQGLEQQVTDGSLQDLLHSTREEIAAHKRDADRILVKLGSSA